MKRKLLAAFSLLLCLFLAACSESWQERADLEKNLADAAYNDGYEDGYNYGYERGYEDGLAAANVPTYQENASTRSLIQSRDYVLNTKSKVFHFPSCSSVDQMSDKNKQYFEGTREDLIDMGYRPCGRCNP